MILQQLIFIQQEIKFQVNWRDRWGREGGIFSDSFNKKDVKSRCSIRAAVFNTCYSPASTGQQLKQRLAVSDQLNDNIWE